MWRLISELHDDHLSYVSFRHAVDHPLYYAPRLTTAAKRQINIEINIPLSI